MHVEQRFAQGGQSRIRQHGQRQPILEVAGSGLLERHADQHPQAPLSHAGGGGVDGREMIFGDLRGLGIDPPVFRMHHLQTLEAAARFAETAYPHAASEGVLLLSGEIEKPQRQEAGAVANSAQHLAPPAERDFRQQYLAFDRRALSGAQFPQGNQARAVLVAQRQEKQEVLGGFHAQGAQPPGEGLPDAAKSGDRPQFGHNATMHSTSTCAPRGSAATPTAARAG